MPRRAILRDMKAYAPNAPKYRYGNKKWDEKQGGRQKKTMNPERAAQKARNNLNSPYCHPVQPSIRLLVPTISTHAVSDQDLS